MTPEHKKEGSDKVGKLEILWPVLDAGQEWALIWDAQEREVARCGSHQQAVEIAEAISAEPSARQLEESPAPAHRSLEEFADDWVARHSRGLDSAFGHAALARSAFEAGFRLATGATARRLIEAGYRQGGPGAQPIPAHLADIILAEILGPAGAELAWPPRGSGAPSFPEVAELAVWLTSDCTATERAWRDRGIADQKPEEFAFLEERLAIYRRAATFLRELAYAVIGQQAEAIEQTRVIRAALQAIRDKARPSAGGAALGWIRLNAEATLEKLGPEA